MMGKMKIISTILILLVFSKTVLCEKTVDKECFTDICTLGIQYCNTLPHVQMCRPCSDMDDYCLWNNKSEQCLLIACKAKQIENLEEKLQKTTEEKDSKIKMLKNETDLLKEDNSLLKQTLKDGKLQLKKFKNDTISLGEENFILKQELKDSKLQLEKSSSTTLYIVLGISLLGNVICIIIIIYYMCVKRKENKQVNDCENPRNSITSTSTDTNESCEKLLPTEKTEGIEMNKCKSYEGFFSTEKTEGIQMNKREMEIPMGKARAPPKEHLETLNNKETPIPSSSDSNDYLTPSKSPEKATTFYSATFNIKTNEFNNNQPINCGSMHDQIIYKNSDKNTEGYVEQTPTMNITNETEDGSKKSRQTQEETRFPVQAAEHHDSNLSTKVVGTVEI